MSSSTSGKTPGCPLLRVDVIEKGDRTRTGALRCEIGSNLKFNYASLATYFLTEWDPVLYDSLLVAAAVEYCDRTQHRAVHIWKRHFNIRIPVHEPDRWNQKTVYESLLSSLEFLTGDKWEFTFRSRKKEATPPSQCHLTLERDVSAVIPFSNGLDSHAVARLQERKLGNKLVRIRLKASDNTRKRRNQFDQPFTAIPYSVHEGEKRFVETSVRSRGFKFALISGIAAYVSGANHVIVPESGQGALGPVLVPVGQIYEDYRSHPLFTIRMQNFLAALLHRDIRYSFPQIWKTKGETLREYTSEYKDVSFSWITTRSCWQPNRHVTVDHKARQCGICASCMLRRLSVYAAGLGEPETNYVWEDLTVASFESGVASGYDRKKMTNAMREYAIAGTLHLAHIAMLSGSNENEQMLMLRAFQLGQSLGLAPEKAIKKLNRLLQQHKTEWEEYVDSLGSASFIRKWSRQVEQ